VIATPDAGETYAEVAHEAIFRRWERLREWIAAEREFLVWKTDVEAARRAWESAPEEARNEALLMGFALARAQSWLARRAEDLPKSAREFIDLSGRIDAERRESTRQLDLLRVKAEEEAARLRAENEARAQRERAEAVERRFRTRMLRLATAALILVTAFAGTALYQWYQAERQRREADVQRLGGEKLRGQVLGVESTKKRCFGT